MATVDDFSGESGLVVLLWRVPASMCASVWDSAVSLSGHFKASVELYDPMGG